MNNFCGVCGTKFVPDSSFCGICGTEIVAPLMLRDSSKSPDIGSLEQPHRVPLPTIPAPPHLPASNLSAPPAARPNTKRGILIGLAGMTALLLVTSAIALFVGQAKEPDMANTSTVAAAASKETASVNIAKLLPPGAQIIEQADLPAAAGKPRAFVLWMDKPQRHPRESSTEYSCPEQTTGNYFSGPTRVSLIDLKHGVLLNTVKVLSGGGLQPDSVEGKDSFSIPYLIARFCYQVPHLDAAQQGKPRILSLVDYKGDGVPAEFVLYDTTEEICGIVNTTLFGYSVRSDKVLQYPIESSDEKGQSSVGLWVNQVFAEKQSAPGHWDFTWSFGHGSETEFHESVYFDAARESFVRK
jgi:hypothetical protein